MLMGKKMKAKKNAEVLEEFGSEEAKKFNAAQSEEPEDLGVKIGSKYEAFLTRVRNGMREESEACKHTVRLNDKLLEIIEKEIEEEKKNFI